MTIDRVAIEPDEMKIFDVVLVTVVVSCSLLHGKASAQAVESQEYDSTFKTSQVRAGIRHTSDYYYMGRADSAAAPYLSATLGYFHKSGVFIRSSLSYLTARDEQRVDLTTVSGGYDYFGKKAAAGISVTEYFFSDLSYTVQAEMRTRINAYAGYDLSAFILNVDASLGFSESTDVFLGGDISRTLYLFTRRLQVTPAVYMNMGTQRYYNEYYTRRSAGTGSAKGRGKGNGGQQTAIAELKIESSDKFEVLDYEAELQASYTLGIMRFYVSGTWVFPVNPATVITETASYQEELKNGFYYSGGIRLRL